MTKDDRCMIVLAGGKGTRLGPLARENKALVSVQQRPMYAHHMAAALEAGIRHVWFVVPREFGGLMESVHHTYGTEDVKIDMAVQTEPTGPAHALLLGLQRAAQAGMMSAYVVMADSLLPLEVGVEMASLAGTWAAVTRNVSEYGHRSWCHHRPSEDLWHDSLTRGVSSTFVGVMGIGDVRAAGTLVNEELRDEGPGEVGMAPVLNAVRPALVTVDKWRDVGDLESLARARRCAFAGRGSHKIETTEDGWVVKHRVSQAESSVAYDLAHLRSTQGYVPDVRLKPYDTDDSYSTRLIDLPTLAELYLYNPMTTAWPSVIKRVLAALDVVHGSDASRPSKVAADCRAMYVTKMQERMMVWNDPIKKLARLNVNGSSLVAGNELVNKIAAHALPLADNARYARVHGDPNFCNVLASLGTGQVYLIDPRGTFGSAVGVGDPRYDAAKLYYSWHGFAAACHDLFTLEYPNAGSVSTIYFKYPHHKDVGNLLDEALTHAGYSLTELKIIATSTFLSAPPLHPPRQARALYLMGVEMGNELIKDLG